jgi:hypothetical protein
VRASIAGYLRTGATTGIATLAKPWTAAKMLVIVNSLGLGSCTARKVIDAVTEVRVLFPVRMNLGQLGSR